MASIVFNPLTSKFDLVGMTSEEVDAYLKLDQTTPQSVINGKPKFQEGIEIKAGKRLYLDGV